jgi:transposase
MQTRKQELYFEEVIRLHDEYGYGERRISRILPIGHSTVSRWIAIFAAKNGKKPIQMSKSKLPTHPGPASAPDKDVRILQAEVSRLQAQLKEAKLRADAYDEMINVAESKFKISIRKKAGAKR